MKVYKSQEIRKVEEVENEIGTSFIRLMENAGCACAKFILKQLSTVDNITIVCGKGKNGGDGFVIARKLKEAGFDCKVVLAFGVPKADDAIEMYVKAQEIGVDIIRFDRNQSMAESTILLADVIVDCVFGIGFHGEPDALSLQIFNLINTAAARVFAIDVPSGVNTDTAEVCENCIKATSTLAISVLKPAHILFPAREYCGQVTVVEIGISDDALQSVVPSVECIGRNELNTLLPERSINSHKNDFGHVLVIAGSRNMPGAANLCAQAALYTGAGLVTVAFPKSAYASLASHALEVMLCPLDEIEDENGNATIATSAFKIIRKKIESATQIVIGCGLGVGSNITDLVSMVIKNAECPIVIDADGLNAIKDNKEVLKLAKCKVIITPHPGEMARLCGKSVLEVEQSRIETAEKFAREYGATVLLKGPATVVADSTSESTYVNLSGNAGLAKGGSGDVLAGIIGALCAQGLSAYNAACVGAYLHGLSAEYISQRYSKNGMVASDLFAGIRKIYKDFNC